MISRCTSLSLLGVWVLLLFCFQSCKDDITDGPEGPDPPKGLEVDMVSVDVRGYIVGTDNSPIEGVSITSGHKSTMTNQEGYFLLKDVNVNSNAAVLKAAKDGYFEGIRTFVAAAGKVNEVDITLNRKEETGIYDAASGGMVSLPTTRISFPAGATLTADGQPYNGAVSVSIIYLKPTDENFIFAMPGDFRAIDANGNLCGLNSLGLFGVELTGSNGEKLKLNGNSPASVELTVPDALLAKAPSSVPMWHFDETNGLWSEEGHAELTGNTYKAEVKHFSYWNFDDPSERVNLKFRLVDQDNAPLTDFNYVYLKTESILCYVLGKIDENGCFSGYAPKEGNYTLMVKYGRCRKLVVSQSISPDNSNIDLGIIRITTENNQYTTITGKLVDCGGGTVTNGAVSIEYGTYYDRVAVGQDGSFGFKILRCTPGEEEAVIQITDRAGGQTSIETFNFDVGEYDLGTMTACGGKEMKSMITAEFKGKEYTFIGDEEVFIYPQNKGWDQFQFTALSDHDPVHFSLTNSQDLHLGNNTLMRMNFLNGEIWRLVEGVLDVEEFAYDQNQPDFRKDMVIGYLKGTFTAKLKNKETSEIADISGTVNVYYGSLKD